MDDSWVAFLALPLLSRIEQALACGRPTLLGVSALPGCGKSTLCSWVKTASVQLGWRVEHLSLDDFYWPAEALERSMAEIHGRFLEPFRVVMTSSAWMTLCANGADRA